MLYELFYFCLCIVEEIDNWFMSQSDFFNWMPNLFWFLIFFLCFYYLVSALLLPFIYESRLVRNFLKNQWHSIIIFSYHFSYLINCLEYSSLISFLTNVIRYFFLSVFFVLTLDLTRSKNIKSTLHRLRSLIRSWTSKH